jgi:hypothetical protein
VGDRHLRRRNNGRRRLDRIYPASAPAWRARAAAAVVGVRVLLVDRRDDNNWLGILVLDVQNGAWLLSFG